MTLLDPEIFQVVGAVYLTVVAASVARDPKHPTRWRSAAFWLTLAALFGVGRWLPRMVVGYAVIAAVVLAASKLRAAERARAPEGFRTGEAARLGARLFTPAIAVPVIVLVLSFALPAVSERVRPGVTVRRRTSGEG